MVKKKYICKVYCCSANYFLQNMKDAGEKVDMVMTDPMTTYDADFNIEWLKLCYELLKDEGILCSFCSPPTLIDFTKQAEGVGFEIVEIVYRENKIIDKKEPCIIMSKGEWKGESIGFSIFNEKIKSKPAEGFPPEAQKPLEMIKAIIKHFTKKGDLVVDHFLGSGTTAQACIELKRNFKGCEKNEEFCMVAKKRLGFKDMYATGL